MTADKGDMDDNFIAKVMDCITFSMKEGKGPGYVTTHDVTYKRIHALTADRGDMDDKFIAKVMDCITISTKEGMGSGYVTTHNARVEIW